MTKPIVTFKLRCNLQNNWPLLRVLKSLLENMFLGCSSVAAGQDYRASPGQELPSPPQMTPTLSQSHRWQPYKGRVTGTTTTTMNSHSSSDTHTHTGTRDHVHGHMDWPTHKVTPSEAVAHITYTPTCNPIHNTAHHTPAFQGLAHLSPAVAAPTSLSPLPRTAFPSVRVRSEETAEPVGQPAAGALRACRQSR